MSAIIGYLVVDRDGSLIDAPISESWLGAQAIADKRNIDNRTTIMFGAPYRVTELREAAPCVWIPFKSKTGRAEYDTGCKKRADFHPSQVNYCLYNGPQAVQP